MTSGSSSTSSSLPPAAKRLLEKAPVNFWRQRPHLHDACNASLVEIRDAWNARDLVETHVALDIIDEMKQHQAEKAKKDLPK